ncbi:MAG TPA: VTT domain-containing protein [Candidatus Binatia bacterium]|nr:VTT domain-containing protein [Candidatus Binatia bacterium]
MPGHAHGRIGALLSEYGLVAVFVATFAEGIGIPLPGQTLLVAAAVLAARGEISLAAVVATGAVASAGGLLAGWAIGRYGGRRLLERFAGARLKRVEDLFCRYDAGLVTLGRFVDGARQLTGLVAGALGMELRRFLAWDVVGAVLWTGVWAGGAWFFTRHVHAVATALHHVGPWMWLAAIAAVSAVVAWIVHGSGVRVAPESR